MKGNLITLIGGNKDKAAAKAQILLDKFGGGLMQVNHNQLLPYLTEGEANRIMAAIGLRDMVCDSASMSSASETARMFRYLADLQQEQFWIALLNRRNQVLRTHMISQGGITGTVVCLPTIIREAINTPTCCSVILCHNHPSGHPYPSEADDKITEKTVAGLKLVDITVLDHVIIAGTKHYSYADERRI